MLQSWIINVRKTGHADGDKWNDYNRQSLVSSLYRYSSAPKIRKRNCLNHFTSPEDEGSYIFSHALLHPLLSLFLCAVSLYLLVATFLALFKSSLRSLITKYVLTLQTQETVSTKHTSSVRSNVQTIYWAHLAFTQRVPEFLALGQSSWSVKPSTHLLLELKLVFSTHPLVFLLTFYYFRIFISFGSSCKSWLTVAALVK
jgi:hypothetical protein